MADNVELNLGQGGKIIATEDVGGVQHELVIVEFSDGAGGTTKVDATHPLPVTASLLPLPTGAATETTQLLQATAAKQDTGNVSLASIDSKLTNPLPISGTVTANTGLSQPLTDTQLRATAVPISGTVTANTGLAQPLTDTQLRATPVPVSGTVTVDTSLLSTVAKQDTGNASLASIDGKLTNPLPISGTVNTGLSQPLTDTQLRATPVPISGTVTANTGLSQPLTDTQLRATPVPVSGTVTVDTSLLATQATLAAIKAKTDNIPALGQALAAASTPVVLTAAEEAILSAILTITDFDTKTGSLTETAPATDTASSGLNGRLQRIAQRLTTLITATGTPFQAGGSIGNTSFASTIADGANVAQGAVADVAWVSGNGTVISLLKKIASSGGGAVSIADGADIAEGALADAIVAAGATGSVSAKLRRATQGLEDLKSLIILAAGTNVIGALVANQSVNNAQVNGVTVSTGSGVMGTGVQRVAIASDNDAVTVKQATATNLKVQAASTQKPSIGATVVLAVTALQSLTSSATVGWGSVRVSNLVTLATDYEIMVKLTTANTAPASDKCMYVFAVPWYTSDAGTTWFPSSQGTTTLPSGTDAGATIASPHNLRLLGVLNYTTAQAVVQDTFLLSNCFGNRLPDGFSITIINFSGATLSTGCIVDYSPINDILI